MTKMKKTQFGEMIEQTLKKKNHASSCRNDLQKAEK